MTTTATPDTVLFIHGLYLSYHSWEGWVSRYESKGFKVLAPGWPGMDGTVEQMRNDPKAVAAIANMQVEDVLDHYERIIRGLPSLPIIIGHSFGGTFMQVLVDRGLAAAAIGLSAGTVRGIRDLPLNTVKSNWVLLRNPFARKKAVMMTTEQFHFGFTNSGFSDAAAKVAYDKYAVPGARNVLFTVPFSQLRSGTAIKVDWHRQNRAPILFLANGQDHVVPASVNWSNYKKYVKENPAAITAIREYPDRPHFSGAMEGWEAIADFALEWALNPVSGVLTGESSKGAPSAVPV